MRPVRRGPRDAARGSPRTRASVRIDLDALGARRARGPAPALDPERHYLEGSPRGRRRVPAHARRDQLRLGLVPDAAQARRAARATSPSPGRWPTASARTARGPNAELRAMTRRARSPTSLGQDPDHELMALYAQALRELGRVPRRPRRARTSSPPPGGSAERAGRAARRRACALVRRPRLLQARADRRRRPRARRRRRRSTTSTASRSSPTTSSPTCCACDGVLRYDPRPGRAHRRRRAAAARARRSARSAPAPCTPAS